MKKILEIYWDSAERHEDYAVIMDRNPEYVEIMNEGAELSQELIKLIDRDKYRAIEANEGKSLAISEKTAFEMGFNYACELMQALGFGGVVNG